MDLYRQIKQNNMQKMKSSMARSRGIQLTHNKVVRQRIDQIISKDYAQLKQKGMKNILGCGTCTHNPLVMDYIRAIYDQYKISDPMNNQRQSIGSNYGRQPRPQLHRSGFQTPDKIVQDTFINTTYTPGEIDLSREANNNQRYSQVQHINISRQQSNHQSKFIRLTPKNIESREQIGFLKTKKINQSFRYCIACEKAILQANIQSHQQECEEFHRIYQMDIQDILKHTQSKITRIQQQLQLKTQNISAADIEKFRAEVGQVLIKSKQVHINGQANDFIKNYNQAISVGTKWGHATEQLNKLRWFIRIREQIKSHFLF